MLDDNGLDAPPKAGHNRPPLELAEIDPEALVLLSAEQIKPLLDLNYRPLVARAAELADAAERWRAEHEKDGRVFVLDDDDNGRTSDFYRQLSDFAKDGGEADGARAKVKKPLVAASRAVDGWFASVRDPVTRILTAIAGAQTAYIREKVAAQRAEAEAAQRRATAVALAAQEELRAAQRERDLADRLARSDVQATEDAQAAAARERAAQDEAAKAALSFAAATERANASSQDLARSRSVLGTTTSVVTRWTWRLDDITALCRAVAEGKAPPDFVIPNGPVINAAVRGKNGRRECPGITIEPDIGVHRSGA